MKAADFIDVLEEAFGIGFYAGVPDSLLSPFTGEIVNKYGVSDKHIVAANEGNATGLAAGYHLATGKIPCVYMQNSGEGNMLNPYASLLAPEVYRIPCVFVVGWRGEPGTKDEPQHVFQGEITQSLMELLTIQTVIVRKDMTTDELKAAAESLKQTLAEGKCVAFIVEKGALTSDNPVKYVNPYTMKREEALREIVKGIGEDIVVSTTGKASRELFEIREQNGQPHKYDFLTVGSMGHSSSIALSIALEKKDKKVWCIDGDGAALMHMGAMAVIGANAPHNYVHIVINNESHETVGGMPTVAGKIDLAKIAEGCGYRKILKASTEEEVAQAVETAKAADELTFIEIKAALGARSDLGRPTTTAEENKENFMQYVKEI
ncbi:MAG: phosphonopyruvate decarboxylase [Roseburia sp.]|nr:phosphonopyruvate decarboxylase [Roseburia sp.]